MTTSSIHIERVTLDDMESFVFCDSQVGTAADNVLHIRFATTPIGSLGAEALCGALVGWDRPELVDLGVLPSQTCSQCNALAQASLRRYVRS